MHPIHRGMDSFSHQQNQMTYPQHYCPNFEGIPPPMKLDASISPSPYQTWPYGGNYGHSVPVGCHGCCNHHNFPGYYGFRPPYTYYLPPQQFSYCGGYPPFPEAYPAHYVPPPNYSIGHPSYDFDKNVAGDHHCCGCPNHLYSRNGDRGVKIEEHEPQLEKGTSGATTSNSLVPMDLKNQGYPVVWIPSGYLNREEKNQTPLRLKGSDEHPHETKADESLKPADKEPSVRNGWFPFDVTNFGYLNPGGDRKKTQQQPGEDKNQQPFPIFWMPYKPPEEGKGDHEEANTSRVSDEECLPNLRPPAAHFSSCDLNTNQPRVSEENIGCQGGSKSREKEHATQKIIPVKQLEEHVEKIKIGGDDAKAQCASVTEKEESKGKKLSENGTKRQGLSPPKASKLPPVCLRVDPLPKRKNGSSGSSRSPSPSGDRGKSKDLFGKKEMKEKKRKEVEVRDGRTRQDSGEDCKFWSQPQVAALPIDSEEVLISQSKDERKSGGVNGPKVEAIKEESCDSQLLTLEEKGEIRVQEEKPEEVKTVERPKLSELEAAVIIQSAYRGFEARRWELLKKMKKIVEVRDKAADIRRRVEDLTSSSDITDDKKQKLVIGETIMSLLLELDIIQGMHPSVRDFRKSVVKELVSLQEKLDSLTSKISQVPTSETAEDNSQQGITVRGDVKEAEVGLGNIICESYDGNNPNQGNNPGSLEPCQGLVSHVEELTPDSQTVENSDQKSYGKEVCDEPQGNISNVEAEEEAVNNSEDGMKAELLDQGQMIMSETQAQDLELKPLAEPLLSEGNISSAEAEEEAVNNSEDGMKAKLLDQGQMTMSETQAQDLELKSLAEPLPSAGKVDSTEEVKLPSCLGDQSVELLGMSDQALPVEEFQEYGEYTTGNDRTIQGGEVEAPLDAEFGDTNLLKKDAVVGDVEDGGGEEVLDLYEDVAVTQKQGEEISHVLDHVKTNKEEDEVIRVKEGGLLDNTRLEVQEEPQPEVLLAHKELKDAEGSRPKEALPVPSQNEIQGGERREDIAMTGDADNFWEEKEVSIEVTDECNKEITPGEENQEMVVDGFEPEGLKSIHRDDRVIETHFAPDGAKGHIAGGERIPMSPTALSQVSVVSEMGSESDQKLLEENEKLREMMEKLIEAGREQITTISNLSGRVKDLEKKLARKKKLRTRRVRAGSICVNH